MVASQQVYGPPSLTHKTMVLICRFVRIRGPNCLIKYPVQFSSLKETFWSFLIGFEVTSVTIEEETSPSL